MSVTFKEAERIGDIVVKFPQAAEIFKRHGIDFCCGGDQPLRAATLEHNVELEPLLVELNQTYNQALATGEKPVDWSQRSLEDLVHHIVNTHHAYLHQVFGPLTELTTKILRVHGQNHGAVLSQVHRLFANLRMDMEEHMIKEEELVFPQIIDYEHQPLEEKREAVLRAVAELDKEHDATGEIVKQIRRVTNDFEIPDDACGTYAYTFQKLEEVESNIFTHIHLENNVLFERLEHARP